MAAPKGNEFWLMRGKSGRNRIIQTPDELEQLSNDYFTWCKQNPLIQIDYRGKDLQEIAIPHPRVFQKSELSLFCGCSDWRTIDSLKDVSNDFMQVVTRIEAVIRSQKFQYATVGMFNSNIIARDLGLADKQKVEEKSDNTVTIIKKVIRTNAEDVDNGG
jgi:hypothetical protein